MCQHHHGWLPSMLTAWGMWQEHAASDSQTDQAFASRDAVLADAGGLLTCYGVGEDSSAALPHAVVELCFTSSVRFLQPGLLLQVAPPVGLVMLAPC